jgi:hypothetical protein|tara:strand:+ start:1121 stop:2083 length:963 start_codon:yes stop_codon:yes gene_type:complete
MEKLQEQKLRAFIKAGIIKKKKERLEEQIKQALYINKLRSIVKNILLREDTDVNTDTPNRSTGINVLATTLKLVIPIIKQGYEQLTSSPEQRKSFRAHVIQNSINTLVRVDLTTGSEEERRAGDEEREEVTMPDNPEVEAELDIEEPLEEPVDELEEQEEIDVTVGDDDEDKFIDIEADDEPEEAPEPEPEGATDVAKAVTGEKEFVQLGGLDDTGMEMAQRTFPKVQKQIADGYAMLSLKKDKEDYADFLVANLKMYFDQFDQEENVELPEPTSPEYEKAKANTARFAAGEEGATLEEGLSVLKVLRKLAPNHEYFKKS